jgi:hypothetical protein
MTTLYRNRKTGLIQAHPTAGQGDVFNSDEIGEDGKPVKPFVKLPVTDDKIKAARTLMGGKRAPESEPESTKKTTEGDL